MILSSPPRDLVFKRTPGDSLFCMVYKLFVEIRGNLTDEVDSQSNDLFGLQWWERSKQLSRTGTHVLIFEFVLKAAGFCYIPRIRKKFFPHHHELRTDA